MSDLPIDPLRRARVTCEIVRALTAEDLERLREYKGVKPKPLKGLRDSHHLLARLIAQGLSNHEIGAQTGYGQSRISILKADPAFQELVEHYRGKLETIRDFAQTEAEVRLLAIRDEVLEAMHERLQEDRDSFSRAEMLDWAKMVLDRTGYGPSSKSTQVNVNVDLAEKIARGRLRAAAHGRGPGALPGNGAQAQVFGPIGPEPTLTEYHRVERRHGDKEDEG